MADINLPKLLDDRPNTERLQWKHWVIGSHSDQFLPEMAKKIEELESQDPITSGKPVINPSAQPNDLIVIASQRGRHCVMVDQQFPCRVALFDWTGEGFETGANPHGWETISVATECKGHLMEVAYQRLVRPPVGHYVGFIDDDVMLRSSDLIVMLALARIYNLSALQPAVSHTSSLSQEYGWLRQRPGHSLHRVPIVEIMAPFIRTDLLDLAMPFATGIRSGYGLDRFALPLCAAHISDWRFAAIDLIALTHVRTFSSLNKRFSNGLLSKEEELLVRLRLVKAMGMPVDEALYTMLEQRTGSNH
jgi:hypothetical protein